MTDRNRMPGVPDALKEVAANWVIQIQDPGATDEDFAAWQAWLAADPRHRPVYKALEDTWAAAARARNVPWPTDAQRRSDTYDGRAPISAMISRSSLSRGRRFRDWRWRAVAAGLVAAVALLVSVEALYPHHRPLTLETATAEQRSVRLEDGSRVELAGETRLTVDLGKRVRVLRLERGEAYFEVARDATRPFVVSVGDHEVRAVGTVFDVATQSERTVVTVSEGVVQLRSSVAEDSAARAPEASVLKLGAGDQGCVDHLGMRRLATNLGPEFTAPWRDGHLQYLAEDLRYVLDDMNRYVGKKIVVTDPRVGRLRFTGTVFLNRPDEWLATLSRSFPVKVVPAGNERLLELDSKSPRQAQ
jgi:transmembrane sensor